MKYLKLYHIPIAYMIPYTLVILATGVWMFLLSQGLSNTDVLTTLMHIIKTPEPKSLHNFVEVAAPHLFAMSTLIFVLAHFMIFSTRFSHKFSLRVSLLLFILALLNILSYLLISFGFIVSGWVKLLTIFLFILCFIVLLAILVFSL